MGTDRPDVHSQKSPQLSYDNTADPPTDVIQQDLNNPFLCRNVADRYYQGGVEIHFHAAGVFRTDASMAGEFCLVLTKPSISSICKELHPAFGRVMNARTNKRSQTNEQSPMFVDVVQRFKMPQKVRRRIRSIARLQTLDDCLCITTEKLNFPHAARFKASGIAENGERCLNRFRIRQQTPVGHRQRICQMVKARPEILETVSGKLQDRRWRKSAQLTVDDILSCVAIDFIGNSIRATFNPLVNFSTECFQVLIRSL
jgi:hypothetical protein